MRAAISLPLLVACTPGDGPDPAAVAALEAFIAAPYDDLPGGFVGPAAESSPSALGGLDSAIDGHHDMLRAWVTYDEAPHWIFAQVTDDAVQWAAVVAPAEDGTEGTDVDPVATYTEAWGASDPSELLPSIWSDNARYVDPTDEGYGVDGLSRVITDFQDRLPRASVVADSTVVTQQDIVHFRWRIEGGLVRMEGMDIGRLDDDGRLTLIAGFFGALEPDR